MSFDIDGLLDLWTERPDDSDTAEAEFRRWYADPVLVNGTALSVADLVRRAEALGNTFDPMQREILNAVMTNDKVAVAFRMGGRQVGPLATSAGVLPATGREIFLRVIDILTIRDGVIAEITMVADELGALAAAQAVALVDP